MRIFVLGSVNIDRVYRLDHIVVPGETENHVVNLYPEIEYQKWEGFGGAITEAAAYNYSLLNTAQKKRLKTKRFSCRASLTAFSKKKTAPLPCATIRQTESAEAPKRSQSSQNATACSLRTIKKRSSA